MTLPFETLSPILTLIFFIVPLSAEGTSTLDLSLSKVIKGSFLEIFCPSLTKISIISTSLKSPISGTFISVDKYFPVLTNFLQFKFNIS